MKFDLLVESILEAITRNTLGPFVLLKVNSNSLLVKRPFDTPLLLQLSEDYPIENLKIGTPYYFEVFLGKVISIRTNP